eukprot:scaffold40310_cov18-Tisochrysis_lutea.AAC.1
MPQSGTHDAKCFPECGVALPFAGQCTCAANRACIVYLLGKQGLEPKSLMPSLVERATALMGRCGSCQQGMCDKCGHVHVYVLADVSSASWRGLTALTAHCTQ